VSDGIQLTEAQREILAHARTMGHITPSRLSKLRRIGKSTAHEALHAMVAKGAMRSDAGKYYPVED
jgi:DNA-binding IclR family transcriptional regulator